MEAKFDVWQVNFVSKEMLDEKLRLRDERIDRIENEKNENRRQIPTWLSFVAAAALVIVTLLQLLK